MNPFVDLLASTPSIKDDARFAVLIGVAVGLIVGTIAPFFAERLKRWYWAPRLRLDQKASKDAVNSQAKSESHYVSSDYIRLVVKNSGRSTAKNCRAYLTDVRANGAFCGWCDTLRLREAYEDLDGKQNSGADVPAHVNQIFDVMSCPKNGNPTFEFARKVARERPDYLNLLKQSGSCRLSVIVTCDELPPLHVWIEVGLSSNGIRVSDVGETF